MTRPRAARLRARIATAAAIVAGIAGVVDDASAHARSVSYSSWQLDGDEARVTLRLSLLELTRLRPDPLREPQLDAALAAYLTERLQLLAAGRVCQPISAPRTLDADAGKVAFEWRVGCEGRTPDEIRSRFLLDVAPGHLHFARLRGHSGTVERVLSAGAPSWPLDSAASGSRSAAADTAVGTSFAAYFGLGVEHIATGYDHLVFLLALLLLASRGSEVVTIVTGFTVAHSITLALAVLGRLRPEADAVEALIGLSIALVATENAWLLSGRNRLVPWLVGSALAAMTALAFAGIGALAPAVPAGLCLFSLCYFAVVRRVAKPVRLRIAIAFVFGLVHGFGFAAVLEEISLAPDRLARALLGFNLGVEAGQLLVVAALWPALRLLARWHGGSPHRLAVEAGTAAVCAAGIYWLAARAYGA